VQETKKTQENRVVLLPSALACNAMQEAQAPPRGNAHPAKTSGESRFPSDQRAESSAIKPETPPMDAELGLVVKAWPKLPRAIRAGILAMIRAAE
jgi:hypothetical protein